MSALSPSASIRTMRLAAFVSAGVTPAGGPSTDHWRVPSPPCAESPSRPLSPAATTP